MRRLLSAILLLALAPGFVLAASNDGNVEWTGVSHLSFQDRRPLCPLDNESFEVRIRCWRNDVSTVNVHHDADATGPVAATVIEQIGPYDIWSALVPASTASQVRYHFELIDGADNDFYGADGMGDLSPTNEFLIDFTTLSHAPIGATPHPAGGVTFRVWSPTNTSAWVRGQFNGWGLTDPMIHSGEFFAKHVDNAAINQRYKYYFGNTTWNTDPRGRSIDGGDSYNAIVQDPTLFVWSNPDWSPPALEEMVIYQLHVGTFSGLNDPAGTTAFPSRYIDVANRAAHLASLGVNAVMLCPITEFPGDESAGYNPITAWAPERWYGAPNDLKRLVDALHAQGIAVILDIIWNHMSATDNFLWNYDGAQIYFDDPAVETPWGSQNDFDRDQVRDMFVDSAHMWFEEFKIDGFRMDATDFMNFESHGASGWSLMQRLNDEVDNRWADHVVIAEQLPDDDWVTRPTANGGAGFDAQYFDAFTDRLREQLFTAAFGDPEMWKIRDVINGYGPDLSGKDVVNYLELHDEAWPSSGGQRFVKTVDGSFPHDDQFARGRFLLGQGIVLFAPGVPAMLQGSEWLEDHDFGTGTANRIDWSKKTTYADIFSYFQDAIGLRTSMPGLRADAGVNVFHLNESSNVIAFQRSGGDDAVIVLANFSNDAFGLYRIGVPAAGNWEIVLDSQDAAYGGSGSLNPLVVASQPNTRDGFPNSVDLGLAPMGLIVLRPYDNAVSTDPGLLDGTQLSLAPARPNPARGSTLLRFRLPQDEEVRITLHDVRGRRVKVVVHEVLDAGEHERVLSTRELARGTYFVRLHTGRAAISAKLLVLD